MTVSGLLVVFAIALGMCVLGLGLASAIRQKKRTRTEQARKLFSQRREWLEAEFLKVASQSGKPRGLDWTGCDFANEVTFARDRASGQLRALVGVTISFAAVVGGDMEDVEAVGNLRSATAVFHFQESKWTTQGRAVFNLDPVETIRHFQHELERF